MNTLAHNHFGLLQALTPSMVHLRVVLRRIQPTKPSSRCWPKRGTRMWHATLRKTTTLRSRLPSNPTGSPLLLSILPRLITGRLPRAPSLRTRPGTMSWKGVTSLFPTNLWNTLHQPSFVDRSHSPQRPLKTFHAGMLHSLMLMSSTWLLNVFNSSAMSFLP